MATQTYPDGEVVTTTYNAAGQPNALTGTSAYVTNAVYNALGQPTSVALGNGLTTAYTYRADNSRLQQLQVGNLLNLQDTYDPVGNVKTITDTINSNQVLTFTYDALDRLVAAGTSLVGQGQYQESYTYGPTGNLLTKNGVTYGYSDPAHVHAVTHLTGTQRYWYDANGNMLLRAENGISYTQTWNAENRLASVTAAGQTTQFFYDGDGNRIVKVDASGTTLYLGAAYEQNLTTHVVTQYYYLGGQRIAVRQGITLTYLHADHLGSASLATSVTGTLVSQRRYLPYGETRPDFAAGAFPTDRRFTGQREESALGLYDYGARFYSPSLGRFLSPDTIVPAPNQSQSLNRYMYVRNNPVRYTDPSGHFTNEEIQQMLGVNSWDEVLAFFKKGGIWEGNWAWLNVLHQASVGDVIRSYYVRGVTKAPIGVILDLTELGSFFIREGYFRMSNDGKIYVAVTSSSSVNFSGNENVPLTSFGIRIENSYELFAQYEYYGESYRSKILRAEGNQLIQTGCGEKRWVTDVDWPGLGLDAASFGGDAFPEALVISWIATGLNVARYQPDLRTGDKEAQKDLALDIVGAVPGVIGMAANAKSIYDDLGLRDNATNGRK